MEPNNSAIIQKMTCKKIIAGIDFSIENFKKITKDYVGGNAEIITKN